MSQEDCLGRNWLVSIEELRASLCNLNTLPLKNLPPFIGASPAFSGQGTRSKIVSSNLASDSASDSGRHKQGAT